MKTLIISRNDKELVRVPLNKPILLVGRSPHCDAVLRSKNIKPVQFLIEHVSDIELDGSDEGQIKDSDFWTLIDVSENNFKSNDAKKNVEGAGVVLEETPQNFNGFDFKIAYDSLQETDLKRGVLQRSMQDGWSQASQNPIYFSQPLDTSVIEIVYLRKDIDIVTNISHLNKKKTRSKIKLFQPVPQIIFEWEPQGSQLEKAGIGASLTLQKDFKPESKVFEIFNKGDRITESFIENKVLKLSRNDLIHLDTESYDYYLRLVPEIKVDLEKFSWTKDYLIKVTFFVIFVSVILFLSIRNLSLPPAVVAHPPRVIRIEVPPPPVVKPVEEVKKEEPPPPIIEPKKEEPVVEEKKPEPIKPEPVKPEPTILTENAAPHKKAPLKEKSKELAAKNKEKSEAANVPEEKKSDSPPPEGNPMPAPVKPKNVGSLGLLAKLKSAKKTNTKVSADQVLSQAQVTETISGDQGHVVVHQAPKGLAADVNEPAKTTHLSDAAGSLSQESTVGSSTEALNYKEKSQGHGTGLNKLKSQGSNLLNSSDDAQFGFGRDQSDAMQAVGGLTKEDIKKALKENRRAITNCYETALLTKRQLDGRMTFRWEIAADGIVTSIKLEKSELGMPNFELCVQTVIKSIRFPEAVNKSKTAVLYPFVFQGKK